MSNSLCNSFYPTRQTRCIQQLSHSKQWCVLASRTTYRTVAILCVMKILQYSVKNIYSISEFNQIPYNPIISWLLSATHDNSYISQNTTAYHKSQNTTEYHRIYITHTSVTFLSFCISLISRSRLPLLFLRMVGENTMAKLLRSILLESE